jgi:hypothetical protein
MVFALLIYFFEMEYFWPLASEWRQIRVATDRVETLTREEEFLEAKLNYLF